MNYWKTFRTLLIILSAAVFTEPAVAQAWVYPTFQHPHILRREYNVGVASAGNYGTTAVIQWREGIAVGTELVFDAGIADPDELDARLLIGGGLAHRIIQANESVPLDVLLTAGLYGSFGDDFSIFRVPLGATIGHRFVLEGGNAITPYAHPRLTIDFCGGDPCGNDKSDVGVLFDLGVDAELSRQLALRGAVTFGGLAGDDDSDTGFGISLSWKPQGLNPR